MELLFLICCSIHFEIGMGMKLFLSKINLEMKIYYWKISAQNVANFLMMDLSMDTLDRLYIGPMMDLFNGSLFWIML